MMIILLYMYLFEKMFNTFYIASCNCNFEVSPCMIQYSFPLTLC